MQPKTPDNTSVTPAWSDAIPSWLKPPWINHNDSSHSDLNQNGYGFFLSSLLSRATWMRYTTSSPTTSPITSLLMSSMSLSLLLPYSHQNRWSPSFIANSPALSFFCIFPWCFLNVQSPLVFFHRRVQSLLFCLRTFCCIPKHIFFMTNSIL